MVGEEFLEVGAGFGGKAKQHIAQVGKGVEAVAFGGLDEGVVVGGGAASAVGAQEEPVFAAHGDAAQGLFGWVVVDVEYAVVEIPGERAPVVHRIVHRFADGALGQDV